MAYRLLGKNFTPPDIEAKVTGAAKYSEDFRADGMAFIRLMLSPMPHAKVVSVDSSAAEKVPGFLGIMTPSDVKAPNPTGQAILNSEPAHVGAPIVTGDTFAGFYHATI